MVFEDDEETERPELPDPMELEGYMTSEEDKLPEDGKIVLADLREEGVPSGSGWHEKTGHFVICTAGQGPILCWFENDDPVRNKALVARIKKQQDRLERWGRSWVVPARHSRNNVEELWYQRGEKKMIIATAEDHEHFKRMALERMSIALNEYEQKF